MTPAVPSSLRALLAGSVDYAGLFPPAGLALDAAIANHATYVRGDDAWMLACFVLPTAKLPEAEPHLAGRFDPTHPLRISALGPKANAADEFLENLRVSLGALAVFQQAHGDKSTIDQFEAPLPPAAAPDRELLREAAGLIETLVPWPLRVFWEVPFSENLAATLRSIAGHQAEAPVTARFLPFGLKLRTGGTEAAAFPTSGRLAAALVAARDAGVAVKFTAGLHHPVRHFNDALGTSMHGFLNVFAAGVLAREHGLGVAEVQAVLEDERGENFRFGVGGFTWGKWHVPTAALTAHRQFITSFGSCSFDEPCDDLRRLGLMV